MSANVYIALQNNDDTRPIIEAIAEANPLAVVSQFPAMVKIDAPGRLTIVRELVADKLGRDWDLQEIHLNLISLSGNIDETDEAFTLHWSA
ncbi:monooxygenase [Cupriavidus sp. USMAA2-4]|uniref:Phenol hydroxylase component n=2 Tax=Burkholderiaceae TaxID=119060 RepID=O84960_9RALS|nr:MULTISPECIES: MmoB/DmpM family protein [Cupriavidus]AAC32454.1 phenol hydroxylase component [Ralstonia sp. E2]AOY96759.1 monooxygenase [Cupriavidus sp. USMAA2-4]AOZ02837.1 monooxygenase [Cupriavidus sp. USMAHM13]AOZ09791.1 monooxygenase [Cupriavidus malaysiensis]